jgi:ribose 1,5-bisphosphate isomerase
MTINGDVERLINEVRDDKTHGASELARQTLNVLRLAAVNSQIEKAAQFKAEMLEICRLLMSVRPAMATISNGVKQVSAAISKMRSVSSDALQKAIIAQIDDLIDASVKATARITRHTLDILADNDTILTHSYSSTVSSALKAAYIKHHIKVIVTRSGAGRTGERTVWEMDYAGVPAVFIDDTAAGLYILRANKVLVGADRVCVDGGLVNGIGTSLLAAACKYYGVPLYVLCETLKFDFRLKSSEAKLEEKEAAEVAGPGILPERTVIMNPYFDTTPLDMISGIITEDGLVKQNKVLDYIQKLALHNRF